MGRPRKPTSGIQYDSCEITYTFRGERLTGPFAKVPGYRMYDVRMKAGLWWLSVCGTLVTSGDGWLPSRANAKRIILDWRAKSGTQG